MSVSSLGLFFIVVFITCITPGAGVLYTLKNAINYGKANAFLSPTGNAIGVLFMSTLAASGLGAVIHESPVMFYGLQICGCMLLFWFGWKSWTAPAISLSSSIKSFNLKELKQERIHILTSAALLQVTNPMCIVFLLSLFPQFIDPKGSPDDRHVCYYLLVCPHRLQLFCRSCCGSMDDEKLFSLAQ